MSPVQFTTLIRLPFARGSFEDPPQVRSAEMHVANLLIHAAGTMGRRQRSTTLESHLEIFKDE
jgi:hypothetical protein